jgi:hypothetical protein
LSSADYSQIKADTLLNSERIRQKFGSYGVEVLFSDETTRITSLYSTEGDMKVTRTFAVVMYPTDVDSALTAEHVAIISGGSIGQVFKEGGWTIEKRSIYLGQISPSETYNDIYRMMGGIDATELAVYVYVFNIERGGLNFEYATIAEVYHPDYLVEDDLNKISGAVDDSTISAEGLKMLLDTVQSYMSIDLVVREPAAI